MTKTDRIKELIDKGLSNKAIAAKIRCSEAYVRVCRQRVAGVRHDTAYNTRIDARMRQIPEAIEAARAAARRAYHNGENPWSAYRKAGFAVLRSQST